MLNAEKLMRLAENQDFSEIIRLCREEIISAEAKKSGGASFEKSRKAFARYLKAQKNDPKLSVRYYSLQNIPNYGICQCVNNAYSAICVFGEKFSGEFIEKIPNNVTPLNFTQLFPNDFLSYPICIEIFQKDINAAYKFTCLDDRKRRIVKFDKGAYFDLNIVKPVFDVLGDCKVYMCEDFTKIAIIVSEIGIGLICPIKVKETVIPGIKNLSEILSK